MLNNISIFILFSEKNIFLLMQKLNNISLFIYAQEKNYFSSL